MASIGSPPVGSPGGSSGLSTLSNPKKAARSAVSDPNKVKAAQAEVADQVSQIHDQLKQVEQEGQAQVDHLKENYSREAVAESSREETLYASEKLKNYERLRDLQRSQAAEYARVKREGEAELARLRLYYHDATLESEHQKDELLRSTQEKNQKQIDYESSTGRMAADQIVSEKNVKIHQLEADRDQQITTLEKQAHELYDKKKAQTQEAIEKSSAKLEADFQNSTQTHQETLARLTNTTHSQLQKARLDSSRKLDAYNERQNDPFYQMMDLQAQFEDQGSQYVLTARIPEHEQKNVMVAIRGNQIVLSGARRNEEKVQVEPGHQKTTSSYQSFMESFPFTHPVESSKLSHEFKGDQVIVTVPKKTLATEYRPYKMKPARAQVQRPDFPSNLPHVEDELAPKGEILAKNGSGPLVKE
jgi:HSP20 family molecular chaperone IbpA